MQNEKRKTKNSGVPLRGTTSLVLRFTLYALRSRPRRAGYTLLETVLSVLIIGLLVVGMLSVFNYALGVVAENKARTGAIILAEQQLELIRNLPYDAIGTVGGIPAGTLPPSKIVALNTINYTIGTQVLYFDDPFDGTLGGTPNDLLNTDYKKARVSASWTGRYGTKTYVAVTTVAPKGVESSAGGGTLSILVYDANGTPVPQADLLLVNPAVNPPVSLTVQTDATGRYLLPGAPASINTYQITATKVGYSTDKTCAIDPAGNGCDTTQGNPTPSKPHATVIAGNLTEISFAIDRLATMQVATIRQPTPSEWVINTGGGTFDQDNPAIALCPNGNYLFVWRDFSQNNNPRVYAQQYTTALVAVWNPDLAITTSNNQNHPDVTPDASCNIYYAWQDDRNGNQDIYFDKYTAAGVDAWGGAKKMDVSAQSADQTFPQVVVNASSTFAYIVWQDTRTDGGDIYVRKADPNGVLQWGAEVKVNSDTGTAVQSLPVVALNADEQLIFVWYDNRNGHNDVFGQAYTKDGGRVWASDVRFNGDGGTSEQLAPAFTLGSDGTIFAAWEDTRNGNADVYAQRFNASGAPQWSSDVRVNSDSTSASQGDPSIVQASDGSLVIVWEDGRNGNNDIYLQKLDSGSGSKLIAFDTRVNYATTGQQENPEVRLTPTGKIVIVWQDNAGGNYDIKAAFYGDDPQTTTPVGNVPVVVQLDKHLGENPVIYKYRQTHTTDASGNATIPGLEYGNYTLVPTGYTLLRSEPAQPMLLNPNTTLTIILNLQ